MEHSIEIANQAIQAITLDSDSTTNEHGLKPGVWPKEPASLEHILAELRVSISQSHNYEYIQHVEIINLLVLHVFVYLHVKLY